MLRLWYWQKEYANAFIGVYKGVHELRGSNSAYFSCQSNILDFDDNDDDNDRGRDSNTSKAWLGTIFSEVLDNTWELKVKIGNC